MRRHKAVFAAFVVLLSLSGAANAGSAVADPISETRYCVRLDTQTPNCSGFLWQLSGSFEVRVWKADNGGSGRDLFLVHGFAHQGSFYKPLINHILNTAAYDNRIRRIYALDLPGHGLPNSWPWGFFKYSQLAYYDYTKVMKDVLGKIKTQQGDGVEILAGHSMGGQLLQIAQQELLNEVPSRSLRSEFGADRILLLAPIMPKGSPWAYADRPFTDRDGSGPKRSLAADLVPMLRLDNFYLGPYVYGDNAAFRRLFFTDCAGNVVPGAPSDSQIDEIGRTEPFTAGAQATGLIGGGRPEVAGNVFAGPAYRLATVAYQSDYFFEPGEERALHTFLSGEAGANPPGYKEVSGCTAVHDAPYSNPSSVDGALSYLAS